MTPNDLIRAGFTRRQTLLALLGAAGLSACGGGDVASVGGGGTGSFSVGPITGIGSIVINGIRYDDASATISNDDSTFSRSNLRLGMVVAVQGTPVVNGQSTAVRISLGSELVGPAVNIGTSGFEVLGQTVVVDGSTFIDASLGSLSALQANDVVEVHGVADPADPAATNTLRATYIGRKSPSTSEYRIQGIVTAVGATAKTFSIGTLNLSYATTDPDDVRVTPAVGVLVRVRLGTTASSGVYLVNRIRKPEDSFSGFGGEVEFKGNITAFTNTSRFSVNDVPVNAASAAFPEGTAGIVLGALVEVRGSLVNGVFQANRVKPEDGAGSGSPTEFELHGTISAATTTANGGSFSLTSSGGVVVPVDWTNSIEFRDGNASNLSNGRQVEVKGALASGNRVNATRISFES